MRKLSTGYVEATPAKTLTQVLQDIIEDQPGSIAACVAKDTLEEVNPKDALRDVFEFGCVAGTVSRLVYYTDTRAFFDQHYFEIEDLRKEYEENMGVPFDIKGDLKNFYAWFAYETEAERIYESLEGYE